MKEKNNHTLPFLDLPDYDWEKQYKEDCESVRNIPDEYKKDEKDYGEFFIPKAVYIPTEMPQMMKELYIDSTNDLNGKLQK